MSEKAPIDLDNLAEVITSLVMIYSTTSVNFDAVYSFISYYISFCDPTLEGLAAAVREGAYIGREYDSQLVYSDDVFN